MKKLLLSLLCVFALAAATAHAETKTYQLCTNETEILNPDNQFLIVANKSYKYSGKFVHFAVTTATAANTVCVLDAADSGIATPETLTIDAENLGLGKFSFKENGSFKALYEHNSNKYWDVPNSNGLNASESLPSTTAYQLSVTVNSNNTVKITSEASKGTTNRYLKFNSNNFKSYTSGSADVFFYKAVDNGPIKPVFTGFDSQYDVTIHESIDIPTITPTDLTYSFSTENESIISIDENTKKITALAVGKATVKFSTKEVDGKFEAGEGSFIVNVTGVKPTLRFRDQVVYGKLGVGVVWEPVIVEDPADTELRGNISYESSDPSIVSVDSATGLTTVHSAGNTTITATMAPKGDYAQGTASYNIIIVDPNSANIDSNVSDFDFTVEGAFGMTTYSGSTNKYEENITEIPGPYGVVSIAFDDAIEHKENPENKEFSSKHRLWLNNGNYELRINKGGKFTISVPDDYKISKIGFVGSYFMATSTPENGAPDEITNWGDDDPTDINETFKYDWIPTSESEIINSVQFELNTNTAKISKIYVLYEGANSNLKSANLSFNKVINNAYEKESVRLNAVNNPFNLAITYKIENLESKEYTITPTADGYIDVTINKPGYYSLQATSEPDDTYRSGFAIMRVNVYSHLDMTVDGEEHKYATPINTNTTEEGVQVEVAVPELTTLYYQFRDQAGNAIATMADVNDEDCEAGFTPYEDGIYIPAGTRGTLVFYIAAYGYKSPKRYVPLGSASVEGFEHMVHAYGKTARMYYTIYVNGHDDDEEYTVTLKVDNKPFTSTDHEISVVEAPQGAMMRKSPENPITHKATGYIDATGINETNAKKTHTYEITVAHNGATLSDHTASGTFTTDGTTGIEDVAVEGAEAAPEYFNLQGARVAQPAAGHIYIVRRGSKVTKELIK